MFTKLEVANYRNIKKLTLDNLKQINVIVGKNNTGKTTLLESIYLMIAPSNPNLAVKVNSFRNLNQIGDRYWPLIFHNLNLNYSINLKAFVKNPDETRNLIIKPYYKTTDVIDLNTFDSKNIDFQASETKVAFPTKGLSSVYNLIKKNKKRKIVSSIFFDGKKLEHKIKPSDYKEPFNGVFINPYTIHLKDTPQRLSDILIKKELNQIIKVLKKIEPNLHNIALSADSLIYCDIGLKNMIPMDVLGEGFYKIFAIILAISQFQNGIVVIDEIDNGLHNTSLNILWKAIFSFATEYNSQIFASTHSYECIKSLIESSKYNNFERKIKLYRIEKRWEEGKIIDYNYNELENTIERNWEFR